MVYKTMNLFQRIYHFYANGFRGMTVGRTLWIVIIIKLVVMFAVIRLFFMPDILGGFDNDTQRAEAVREHLSQINNRINIKIKTI